MYRGSFFKCPEYSKIAALQQLDLMITMYMFGKNFCVWSSLSVSVMGDKGAFDFEICYFPIHVL